MNILQSMNSYGRKRIYRLIALFLAAVLTLGCATAALAAHIDFDDSSNNTGNCTDDGQGNYTVNDQDNTITGDGSGCSLYFTDPNASVTVQGDVTVGGIKADNDLTITGGGGDTLTSTGSTGRSTLAGIETGGDLTIDGGVTVNANGELSYVGVQVGGDLHVNNNSTLNAKGGAGSSNPNALNVTGDIYVDGTQDTTDYNGKNTVTLSSSSITDTNDGEAITAITLTVYDMNGNKIEPEPDGTYSFAVGYQYKVVVTPSSAAGGTFTLSNNCVSLGDGVFTCDSAGDVSLGYTPPSSLTGFTAPDPLIINIASALTHDQVNALTGDGISQLTTGQIRALTRVQIRVLTEDQIPALTEAQIRALTADQIKALTTDQIRALTTDQISALKEAQIRALTEAQISALTAAQIPALNKRKEDLGI